MVDSATLSKIRQIYRLSKKMLDDHSMEGCQEISDKIIPPGYPEVLHIVAVESARLLVNQGLSRSDALKVGLAVAERVRFMVGGTKFYIPKFDRIGSSETEDKIFREFNGKNCKELAILYNMSDVAIYNIIKRQRKKKNSEHPPLAQGNDNTRSKEVL